MQPEKRRKSSKIFGISLASFFILLAVFIVGLVLGQNDVLKFNVGSEVSSITDPDPVSTDLPNNLDYESVEDLYDLLRKRFDGQLSEDDLIEGLKRGLTEATGDPYTEYFNITEAEEFNNQLDGTFIGIGAELGRENGTVIVVSPLSGFPAESAGLKPRDVIARIDGEDATSLTITQAVNKIRGEEGTDVTLTVVRNEVEVLDITITRAKIDVPSVTSRVEDGIGIISVSRFSEDTTDLADEAAKDFIKQGVNKVILDLRGNPGGFLDQAVSLSGLWLDNSKIVVDVKRDGESQQVLKADGTRLLEGTPTVVLINEGSASASEIVAGALQDHGVATIIGRTSFGKGSVQNLEELDNTGELLKVTTARWFTPNGKNIDEEGITPDEDIEITDEQFEADEDPQFERAKAILNL